jgi:hypothetical protein
MKVTKKERPKKTAEAEAKDAVKRATKRAFNTSAKPAPGSTLGTNRIYRFRDGTATLVCYSNNKHKPEIVSYEKPHHEDPQS